MRAVGNGSVAPLWGIDGALTGVGGEKNGSGGGTEWHARMK